MYPHSPRVHVTPRLGSHQCSHQASRVGVYNLVSCGTSHMYLCVVLRPRVSSTPCGISHEDLPTL